MSPAYKFHMVGCWRLSQSSFSHVSIAILKSLAGDALPASRMAMLAPIDEEGAIEMPVKIDFYN